MLDSSSTLRESRDTPLPITTEPELLLLLMPASHVLACQPCMHHFAPAAGTTIVRSRHAPTKNEGCPRWRWESSRPSAKSKMQYCRIYITVNVYSSSACVSRMSLCSMVDMYSGLLMAEKSRRTPTSAGIEIKQAFSLHAGGGDLVVHELEAAITEPHLKNNRVSLGIS